MSFEPTTKRPRLLSLMTSLLTIGAANGKMNLFTSSIRATTITSAWPLTSSPDPVIGTHDGSFHCDEALAIGMLKILPKFSNSFVVRTRKPELLAQCDIVVDVGAEYDPSRLRFDHHQRGFEHQFDGYKTKLSSAGLVYKHFGKDILSVIASSITDDEMEKSKLVSVSYEKIYKDFMEHIDAIDNGVSVADGDLKYHVSTTLSSRVGRLNPNWNEPSTSDDQNDRFKCAMELTCSEFLLHAESLMKVWWPARSIVQRAIANRHNVHESGKIILLDQFCPWKDHLFELEKEVCQKKIQLVYIYKIMSSCIGISRCPYPLCSLSR